MRKALAKIMLILAVMASVGFSLTASDFFVSLDSSMCDSTHGQAIFTLVNPTAVSVVVDASKLNFFTRFENTPTLNKSIKIWDSKLLVFRPLAVETLLAYTQYRFLVEAYWEPAPFVTRDWVPYINIPQLNQTFTMFDWAYWNVTSEIFYDNFEDGSITDWTVGADWSAGTGINGTYSLFSADSGTTSYAVRAVNATNYTDVKVSFYALTINMDAGEGFAFAWWNGSVWNTSVAIVAPTTATRYDITLPTTRLNLAAFKLNFTCAETGSGSAETCAIDDVRVTGNATVGILNVTWYTPVGGLNVSQNGTFWVNATVTCLGGYCGTITTGFYYNATASYPNTIIPTCVNTPFCRKTPLTSLFTHFYNENTGVTTKDESPNGRHGNISVATWVSGKNGYALRYDGISAHTEVQNSAELFPEGSNANLTVEAWVNISSPQEEMIISKWQSGSVDGTFYISTGLAANTIDFGIMNTTELVHGTGTITAVSLNQWHYVVGVANITHISIYLDGVFNNSMAFVGTMDGTTRNISIGTSGHASVNYFNGTIDDVSVYNYSKTAAEILADYQADYEAKYYVEKSKELCTTLQDGGTCDVYLNVNATGAEWSSWKLNVSFTGTAGIILPNSTANILINITGALPPPPSTYDFSITIPGGNYSNSGDVFPGTFNPTMEFNYSDYYGGSQHYTNASYNYSGTTYMQTGSVPALKFTNLGNVPLTWTIKLNNSLPSWVSIFANDTSAIPLTTRFTFSTANQLDLSVAVGSTKSLWVYCNFTDVTQLANTNATSVLNHTSS